MDAYELESPNNNRPIVVKRDDELTVSQIETRIMQMPVPKNAATYITYVKRELEIRTFQSTNDERYGMNKPVLVEELDETELKSVSTVSQCPSVTYKASSSGPVIPSDLAENKNTALESESKVEIVTHDKYFVPLGDLYFEHCSKDVTSLFVPAPSVAFLDKSKSFELPQSVYAVAA